LIGFNPTWADANVSLCRRLIRESDFCATAAEGIRIGDHFTTRVIEKGRDGKTIPSELVCVAHEFQGKVIIVEEVRT
jgi:hypothetical protein